MKTAITFVNNRQTSIVSSKEELIKEINHYQAFWLSSTGNEYSNPSIDKNGNSWKGNVKIIVHDLTEDDRKWLSARMR